MPTRVTSIAASVVRGDFEFGAMGSRCSVRLAAPDAATARRWADAALAEVRRIEHKYSRYRDDSIVSRINAAAGRHAVACDSETQSLLAYADALHQASGGSFDITSGVLRRAWDFKAARLPRAGQLEALCALVGWQRVERDGGALRLPVAGMELDFGGFGKEYAADRAAAALHAAGARHGFGNLGGDLHAIGPQPDGRPWTIAIQDPRAPQRAAAEIELASGGLVTSGDYERFFELDGGRYCHLLNPFTGWPVNFWRSVSVAAPLCIAAGSVTTLAMLAESRGREVLRNSGLAFLAIDDQGQQSRGQGVST